MQNSRIMTMTLAQMDVKIGDQASNLATVRSMTAAAAQEGADLIVFPELWPTGYDLEAAASYATEIHAGMFATVAGIARQHGIAIAGSQLSLLGEGQHGNTAVYFDKEGRALGSYSKIHLFRLMDEDQYLTAGSSLAMVDTIWAKMGLAICYDLRFPEMFRSYALDGAQAVILPSEWPDPRKHHWLTLLQARAIENQMFLIACNRVGTSGETNFFGHSCVVDPWGEFIILADEKEGLWTAEIDFSLVSAVRQKIPVFADRRPDLY
jgi:predicted amidohydrolase